SRVAYRPRFAGASSREEGAQALIEAHILGRFPFQRRRPGGGPVESRAGGATLCPDGLTRTPMARPSSYSENRRRNWPRTASTDPGGHMRPSTHRCRTDSMNAISYRALRTDDADGVFEAARDAWQFTYATIFDPNGRRGRGLDTWGAAPCRLH